MEVEKAHADVLDRLYKELKPIFEKSHQAIPITYDGHQFALHFISE